VVAETHYRIECRRGQIVPEGGFRNKSRAQVNGECANRGYGGQANGLREGFGGLSGVGGPHKRNKSVHRVRQERNKSTWEQP
jgi:hypothetical protein